MVRLRQHVALIGPCWSATIVLVTRKPVTLIKTGRTLNTHPDADIDLTALADQARC